MTYAALALGFALLGFSAWQKWRDDHTTDKETPA
jgi:hypothetical protein